MGKEFPEFRLQQLSEQERTDLESLWRDKSLEEIWEREGALYRMIEESTDVTQTGKLIGERAFLSNFRLVREAREILMRRRQKEG